MSENKAAETKQVHPDVSDMFFNTDHDDIKQVDGTGRFLGYVPEKLHQRASAFVESLKRIGAHHVPDVKALLEDFQKRH